MFRKLMLKKNGISTVWWSFSGSEVKTLHVLIRNWEKANEILTKDNTKKLQREW